MPPTTNFESRIATNWPTERWADEVVIVATSGGADSTALVRALHGLKGETGQGRLVVAHFNHGLRGAESDADEAFVRALAGELGLEAVAHKANVAAAADERGDGIEEAARAVRYRFLEEAAGRLGARYITTAHTLDDQAETLLLRILRGTGITGLGGIPKVRGVAGNTVGLVRPMLNLRRGEVLEYMQSLGQAYREDSSNTDRSFARNRVRHNLLPQLAHEYNPRIVEVLANLATQAAEMQAALRPTIEAMQTRSYVRGGDDRFELDCAPLIEAAPHVVREVFIAAWTAAGLPLQAMGFAEWTSLAEMAATETPAQRMFPGGVTARRTATSLEVRR